MNREQFLQQVDSDFRAASSNTVEGPSTVARVALYRYLRPSLRLVEFTDRALLNSRLSELYKIVATDGSAMVVVWNTDRALHARNIMRLVEAMMPFRTAESRPTVAIVHSNDYPALCRTFAQQTENAIEAPAVVVVVCEPSEIQAFKTWMATVK